MPLRMPMGIPQRLLTTAAAGHRKRASAASPLSWTVLTYDYAAANAEDLAAARAPLRSAHLAHAAAARALVLGGALGGPGSPGGLLVFATADAAAAEKFAQDDPYVKGGLVRSWKVRPWTVVVDALA